MAEGRSDQKNQSTKEKCDQTLLHHEDSNWEWVPRVWPLGVELYKHQQAVWPSSGKHILATYDDTSIVVYQAFSSTIAECAVRDQRFGGGGFSFNRMSWVKTNFLWMMYRSGWASKPGQERVLAVRIMLEGFNDILAAALTGKLQKSLGIEHCEVRLQWDPDHAPNGENVSRRAIQLGLKDQMLKNYCTTWIISITDITSFVHHQHHVMKQKGPLEVSTPCERVYSPSSTSTCQQIELDNFQQ